MAYFAGPNVKVSLKQSEATSDDLNLFKEVTECAGVSFSLGNSQQPIYGYASTNFDAMLPGREIIQGNLLVNFTKPKYLFDLIHGEESINSFFGSYNGAVTVPFDLKIEFMQKNNLNNEIIINYCYIIGAAQTAQISDQPIVEEYSFIGRSLSYNQY